MVFVKPAPGLEPVLCPGGAEIALFEMESANLRRSAIKAHVFGIRWLPSSLRRSSSASGR